MCIRDSLLTMRGGPCIYQGSEIGMINVAFETLEEYDDVEVINLHKEWKAAGRDTAPLLKAVQQQGRDNARTPIQWSREPHAGFTTGTPWLKVNPNFTEINVEAALADEDSIFHFYKKMLAFRKANKTLIYGDLKLFLPEHEQIFAFQRKDNEGDFIVVLNFSDTNQILPVEIPLEGYQLTLSNYQQLNDSLRPWESRVYRQI